MAGFDFLMGGTSDQDQALRTGLLAAGLGMLQNSYTPGGMAAPALGAGGLAGLQAYQGSLDQSAQNRANAFKMQQQEAAMRAAENKQAYTAALASGQRQFNPNEALAAGFSIDEIKGLGEFGNLGKARVKEYREIRLPDGRVVSQGFDEFGQPVGEGQTPFKAPTYQDLGGRVVSIDPLTGKIGGEFGKTMTPDGAASNAVARANLGISQQRLAMDRANSGGYANNPMLKGAPAGYMWRPDGTLAPIPGGPAAAALAKDKAPTEYQSKSATFGARAERADKILGDLEGKYSAGAVSAKQGAENVYGLGGVLGTIGNVALPKNAQKADQAQKDFLSAVLRLESGAVIGPSEFAFGARQYFPQPGDSKEVLKQKEENRKVAIQGFKNAAGPAAFSAAPAAPANGGWSAKRID